MELKSFRPIMNRNRRKMLLQLYPILSKIFKCTSKYKFMQLISSLNLEYKQLMKTYLTKFFIVHLHLRQLKNISGLMAYRHIIYDSIDNPEILSTVSNNSNNLIKNFCKGLVNFVVIFYDDLIREKILPKSTHSPLKKTLKKDI